MIRYIYKIFKKFTKIPKLINLNTNILIFLGIIYQW